MSAALRGIARWRTVLLAAVGTCVLAFGSTNALADTLARVAQAGALRCGVINGNPKFSERDADSKWDGYDVAFCEALAKRLHATMQIVPLAENNRVRALTLEQSVDVVVAYPDAANERAAFPNLARVAGVSQPYIRLIANDRMSFASILVPRDDPAMLNWVDMFIWDMIRTGEQEKLFLRYFGYTAPALRFP